MARPEQSQPVAPRIDEDRARSLFDRRAATFVDVRYIEQYRLAHVPGALPIPLAELSRRIGEIPRGKPVVVY